MRTEAEIVALIEKLKKFSDTGLPCPKDRNEFDEEWRMFRHVNSVTVAAVMQAPWWVLREGKPPDLMTVPKDWQAGIHESANVLKRHSAHQIDEGIAKAKETP